MKLSPSKFVMCPSWRAIAIDLAPFNSLTAMSQLDPIHPSVQLEQSSDPCLLAGQSHNPVFMSHDP